MSEIIDCDPNKGFVAFPVALFDLDLTPGAFRTLAELCRMANTTGQCWPSLAQLGRQLGRSRAAVSGYITELRAAGVLSTEEQKMANGYNYRLRYTVTFWKDWRASLSKDAKPTPKETAQKAERRVQPSERPLRTKNHIYKKQQVSGDLTCLVSGWKHAVGNAPYPDFAAWPTEAALAKTRAAVEEFPQTKGLISADIDNALNAFSAQVGLEAVPESVISEIKPHVTSIATLNALVQTLKDQWQPHWKQPPNSYQLTRILKALPPVHDATTELKLLKSYLRRWKLHQRSLPSVAIRSKVAA